MSTYQSTDTTAPTRVSLPTIRERKVDWIPILLLAPAVLILLSMVIYPLIYAAINSFMMRQLMDPEQARFVGLDNFIQALQDREILGSLGITLEFVAVTVVVEFLLGLSLALLLSRQVSGIKFIAPLLILPMLITPTVSALVWRQLMFNADTGLLNYYLMKWFHVQGPIWLGVKPWALISVMILDIWIWTPFVVLLLLSGLNALPHEPMEAARIDGAGSWQVFRDVTLPLLKPVIVVVLLFRIIDGFKAFDTIYVLTGGGPGTSTEVFGLTIYKQGFKFGNVGFSLALSWILIVIITIIAMALIRRMAKELA